MRKAREGFAIFVVLIGVLVLSTVTLTALDMGTQESRSARATRVSASALYAAETGVSVVRAGAWPSLAVGGTWDPGQVMLPNGGRYRPVIQRRDNGVGRMQIYSLTVEGWSPGPRGGEASVQVWATRFLNSLFTAAVSAKSDITMSGATNPSFIDSYDSRLGDYGALLLDGATNKGTGGDIRANGDLNISGDVRIEGDVTVSGKYYPDNERVVVTGTVTEGAPKEDYPAENCPDYTPISGPGITYKNGSVTLANLPVTFTSGTYSFHNFKLEGGAILVVPAGNSVKIYASGYFEVGGGSSLNNEGKNPSSLSLTACNRAGKANTTTWEVGGSSDTYFTVYAPNNTVNLNGSGQVYGAIIANRFVAGGGASVHFDVALNDNTNTFSTIMPRSWRQLLR